MTRRRRRRLRVGSRVCWQVPDALPAHGRVTYFLGLDLAQVLEDGKAFAIWKRLEELRRP